MDETLMDGPPLVENNEESAQRRPSDGELGTLFSQGGPFEGFPGPVLLVGHNGIVLSANGASSGLTALIRENSHEELLAAVRSGLRGVTAQVNPLFLAAEGDARQSRCFDVVVLPWAEGTAALLMGREITLERSLRVALIESRQRFKDLVELAADFAWECDGAGCFTYLSRDSVLGYLAADLLGREAMSLVVRERSFEPDAFLGRKSCQDSEVWLTAADGSHVCLSVTAAPLYDSDGLRRGTRGLCRDVTESCRREAANANAHYRHRLLNYVLQLVRDQLEPNGMLSAAADALKLAIGAQGVAVYFLNPGHDFKIECRSGDPFPTDIESALLRSLGRDSTTQGERHAGHFLASLTEVNNTSNGLLALWRQPGDQPWQEDERALVLEVAAEVALAIEQLTRERNLSRLSETDPLTGIMNRRGFLAQLENRLARDTGETAGSSLFYVDIDDFKQINDTNGHLVGDEVLVTAARLFTKHTRAEDLIGRLGGDEFALYLGNIEAEVSASKAQRLIDAWQGEIQSLSDGCKGSGLSIGIAHIDGRARESHRAIIDRADKALYKAKGAGKSRYMLSEPTPLRPGCSE